jgi:hypothetical protein
MFQRCAPGARRWWQPCSPRADRQWRAKRAHFRPPYRYCGCGALLSTDSPSTRLMAMR